MPGRGRHTSTRKYPRVARVNEVIREVIADELERIDDDRLGLITITGVSADPDLRNATVWVSALMSEGGVETLLETIDEHRAQLQGAIARQLQLKRTPHLRFSSDPAIESGQRIEDLLRDMKRSAPDSDADDLG